VGRAPAAARPRSDVILSPAKHLTPHDNARPLAQEVIPNAAKDLAPNAGAAHPREEPIPFTRGPPHPRRVSPGRTDEVNAKAPRSQGRTRQVIRRHQTRRDPLAVPGASADNAPAELPDAPPQPPARADGRRIRATGR
jgi:hypothetical protein